MNEFDNIISCCRELLLNFPEAKGALEYANKRLSKEGQDKFQFGYFPTNKHLNIFEATIGKDILYKLDLLFDKSFQDIKYKSSPMENHNLIIPYRDVYGNVIAIVGRSLLSDEQRAIQHISKYKNTSFQKGNHLFGLFEAKEHIIKNNLVFVVEGQFDCITSYDKGLKNVVALGSSNMTFEQFALLSRYTNNIILLLDNDDAGKLGSNKIIKTYSKYANIKKAALPTSFKDVDEYLSFYTVDDLFSSIKI